MDNAQVTIDLNNEVPIIRAVGELDVANVALLQDCLGEIPHGTARAIVDLAEVTFVDSSVLGVLVEFQQRLGPRVLRLVIATDSVFNAFKITSLQELFPIVPSIGDAIVLE